MPQSSFSGWSAPNSATSELGWSASWARSSAWIAGLDIDCTLTIVDRPLREAAKNHRKSGHKKPGLNIGSAGITTVPGLFSELFNVAASRPAQMTTEWLNISRIWAFRQGKPIFVRTSPGLTRARFGGSAQFPALPDPIVRGRPCAVSNHEGERATIRRDAAKTLLLT